MHFIVIACRMRRAIENIALARICIRKRIPPIKSSKIDATKHLHGSKLLLNEYGPSLLAGNYSKFLKNYHNVEILKGFEFMPAKVLKRDCERGQNKYSKKET